MEINNSIKKRNLLKKGGEEENNQVIIINKQEENTKEKMKYLFPNLSQEEINNVLERTEYNMEKAISLIRELKEKQKKLSTVKSNSILNNPKFKTQKRNYNDILQQKEEQIPTNNNNTQKTNNTKTKEQIEPNNDNINVNKKEEYKQSPKKEEIVKNVQEIKKSEGQIKKSEGQNVNKNNSNEDNRIKLIQSNMDSLINKMAKMTDISELKKFLTELGFPKEKEEKVDISKLEETVNEKIKNNKEEKESIIKKYKEYNKICQLLVEKENKIDELTSTLANLIEAESGQKISEEKYKNELIEYIKILNNNNRNEPKEGY